MVDKSSTAITCSVHLSKCYLAINRADKGGKEALKEIKNEQTKGKNITDKSRKLRSLPDTTKHNTPNPIFICD